MNISTHISELLFEHDCVIIPGFGGFIATKRPSYIHPVTNLIYPPSKKIAFNINLQVNDGLLAGHIAAKEQFSYSEGLSAAYHFGKEIKEALSIEKQYTLKNIGSFHSDAENKIVFTPDPNSSFLYESYGLGPVQVKIVEKVKAEEAVKITKVQVKEDRPAIQPERKTHVTRSLVFTIIFLLLTGGFLAIVNFGAGSNSTLSSLNLFDLIRGSETEEEKEIQAFIVPADQPAEETNLEAEELIEAKPEEIAVEKTFTPDSTYFIIGGAFSSKRNAEKYIRTLERNGFNPEIAGQTKRGLIRISIDKCNDPVTALEKLESIQAKENQAAWILTVKYEDSIGASN